MGDYTRTAPDKRTQTLLRFSQRMNNCPAVQQELKSWDLALAQDLEKFQARTLQPEEILVGNNKKCTYKVRGSL